MFDEGTLSIRAKFRTKSKENYMCCIYLASHEEFMIDNQSQVWNESRH